MLALCAGSPPQDFVLSSLAYVEVHSGLRRRERTGDLSANDASRALELLTQTLLVVRVEQITAPVCDLAAALINRQPLRSLDAVQLASALHTQAATGRAIRFVTADRRLLAVAADEGLFTWNPNPPASD